MPYGWRLPSSGSGLKRGPQSRGLVLGSSLLLARLEEGELHPPGGSSMDGGEWRHGVCCLKGVSSLGRASQK